MSNETQLAVRPKASQQLAVLIGMESGTMLDTIKAQCFKCAASQVSDAQLAAFVSVAAAMEVNPLLPGMLYAYPTTGGGIVPIMGPDGIYKKMTEHGEIDSWETVVYPEDVTQPPTHATTRIWRKGRERPLTYTALLSEWKINSNPNWNSRPRHMLGLRSLKHCARQIIHGLPYDEDDRVIMGEVNVTPGAEHQQEQPARKSAPERSKKGVAAVVENTTKAEAQKTATIDVAATTVVEPVKEPAKESAKVIDAVLEKEPVAETKPVAEEKKPEATVSRAFLKDGEEMQAVCQVVEVTPLIANMKGVATPSVQVSVKGQFFGTVFHFGGATAEGDKITPNPLWKIGGSVQLSLVGRLNNKTGKVLVRVEKLSEASAASLPMDVE